MPPKGLPDWLSCCYLMMSGCLLRNNQSGPSIGSLTTYAHSLDKLWIPAAPCRQNPTLLPPPTLHYHFQDGKQSAPSPRKPSSASPCMMAAPASFLTAYLSLSHSVLQVHTFRGPHWCEHCASFMWGLMAQGVKCSGAVQHNLT